MKYIAKKFGSLLLTLLLVSFLSFFAFSVIPGDAAKSQLGTEATPERIEALQKEMGLDRPVLERYASWVTGFFHGDLGTSYSYSMPVGELIRDKVPITIAITVIAFLMILVASIPIGIFTAQHAGGHLSVILLHRLPPLHFRAVPWLSKCCAALCSRSSMPTMCAPPIPAETVHAVLCITMC